jgi:hypothetical protein
MAGNGITGDVADAIYAKIEAFGNFGFAESHSISFALLVYASTWFRVRYCPAAFLAALLHAQPMGFYSPQRGTSAGHPSPRSRQLESSLPRADLLGQHLVERHLQGRLTRYVVHDPPPVVPPTGPAGHCPAYGDRNRLRGEPEHLDAIAQHGPERPSAPSAYR